MTRRPQARAIAAQIISAVIEEGQTLTMLLPNHLKQLPDRRDQALAQELCYGVIRVYQRLEFLLNQLLEHEIKAKDTDIKTLILIGLYQLIYLRTPPHAAVAATAGASQELGKPWATGLVNAILRRYQRESEHLLKLVDSDSSARYSHPIWLLNLIQHEYPDQWPAIISANNTHPPMTLRINPAKVDRTAYKDRLAQAGIMTRVTPHSASGLILEHSVDVEKLPGFSEGWVSVQDLAAQLTPDLLDLRPGLRLLDACAAPGGKLAHIMAHEPDLAMVAGLEIDPYRMERLQHTLRRLDLHPVLIHADARLPEAWWDGVPFDRILLDAPCSATGIIRRHPDIKLLRTPEEVETAVKLQADLLNALWPLLKTGGKLLYVTCSVLSCENDRQIEQFIYAHADANVETIPAAWGTGLKHGRQILPGQEDMDGFYYALLCKT